MSGVRFVRLYPSDWRSGCIGLTLEQEGLYIRVCTFIFETEKRLPLDDGAAAKFMGLHTNAYRKVRDQLAALGKLTKHTDGWTVARAERELAAASYQKREADRPADQNTPRETRQDTLGDTPLDTPIDTPQETPQESRGVISEKPNENNAPLKSLSHNHSEEGVCEAAPGVFVNCETIKHRGFTISLPAIHLATVRAGLSKDEVKTRCLAHALQWAAEIDAGKMPRDVVPAKIANFLAASIMGEVNRDSRTIHRTNATPVSGKTDPPKKTLSDVLRKRDADRAAGVLQ